MTADNPYAGANTLSMPGGIRISRRYTDMAAFRRHEPELHARGWRTTNVKEQPVRGGVWRRLFGRRPPVDVSYTR